MSCPFATVNDDDVVLCVRCEDDLDAPPVICRYNEKECDLEAAFDRMEARAEKAEARVAELEVQLAAERKRVNLARVAAEHTCDACSGDGGHDGWPRDHGLCDDCPTATFRAALAEMDRGGER